MQKFIFHFALKGLYLAVFLYLVSTNSTFAAAGGLPSGERGQYKKTALSLKSPLSKLDLNPIFVKNIQTFMRDVQGLNIVTIGDLIWLTENDLLRVPRLGEKTVAVIKRSLAENGFSLAGRNLVSWLGIRMGSILFQNNIRTNADFLALTAVDIATLLNPSEEDITQIVRSRQRMLQETADEPSLTQETQAIILPRLNGELAQFAQLLEKNGPEALSNHPQAAQLLEILISTLQQLSKIIADSTDRCDPDIFNDEPPPE